MKKYLYYPNLEPPNTEWLKFSILYLEKFESIVPEQKQYLISDDYRRLSNETDLVEMYSPTYEQGERASLKSIDEIEKFLKEPDRQSSLVNVINVNRKWRDENNWNHQILFEKFSLQFSEYCLKQKIGKRNGLGLMLPKELAFMFMTHLAKEISFERNGSIITDNIEFDNYSNYSRVHNPEIRNRNKFMKGIINLLVPANISEVSFSRLIEFRNQNRERITMFNNQINVLEESIGNGLTEREFIDSFNSIYSELTREVVLLGTGIATISFSTYMKINNTQALSAEYYEEIIGAIGLGVGGTYSIKKTLFDTKEKRFCKKYFANLRRLQ